MSGGSASSKSSAIQIFPLEHPGTLGSLAETSGTRRARGFPALAMMISSPLGGALDQLRQPALGIVKN
jgi:hypothetical protein